MGRTATFSLVVTFLTLMYTGALAAGPRLLASPETWEMGNAHQWDSPSTEIDIKNTGDQPLVVERIKPACGFTAHSASRDRRAPIKRAARCLFWRQPCRSISRGGHRVDASLPARDLACVDWCDASTGKSSLNGGIVDVPTRKLSSKDLQRELRSFEDRYGMASSDRLLIEWNEAM